MMNPRSMGARGLPQQSRQTLEKVEQKQSLFNPTDVAMMIETGKISPQMPVVDMLKTMGIDPEGPVSQLAGTFKKQMDNANPVKKMRSLAGGKPPNRMPQGRKPMAQPQQRPQQPGPGSFDEMFPRGG
jgi:hypothetical protein